ncbi:hypothetical protein ACFQS1_12960 [Paractinoplanes rhizophilus]|uniref:Uncharacterized protein n=1 Tax=Paractinoplanes rhizophilus TaxID=1416877 RepID=A0ABW2HP51_9ACTN
MTQKQVYEVPEQVLSAMLIGVETDTVQSLVDNWKPGKAAHPGDPFGRVFLWLWRTDSHRAVTLFNDVVRRVRRTKQSPAREFTSDDLLHGLSFATQGMTDSEAQMVSDQVRADAAARLSEGPEWPR